MFSPILRTTTQIATAAQHLSHQKFLLLLIITDGVINDMEATVDEIVRCSDLPLSIVIVGVGSADFAVCFLLGAKLINIQNMEILDADDTPLRSSNGTYAKRDIVQVRKALYGL